jgi:enamine deaminase RidA (YjgF/YER057c/UK114 family)
MIVRQPLHGGRPWPDKYTFVPAVRVGDTVYISGTTGTDEQGRITAPGDIAGQTRQIFRKFEALLQSAGGTCDDIVATTDFITTTEGYEKTAAVRREFFRRGYPTATGVCVAGLLRKDALIEISAIAVIGSSRDSEPTGSD